MILCIIYALLNALLLQISKCGELRAFSCNFVASKTATADLFLQLSISGPCSLQNVNFGSVPHSSDKYNFQNYSYFFQFHIQYDIIDLNFVISKIVKCAGARSQGEKVCTNGETKRLCIPTVNIRN